MSGKHGSQHEPGNETGRLKRQIAELEAEHARLVRQNQEGQQAKQDLDRTLDELKRSNEELEQFAYIASHDLQEPLRKIVSFGERLEHRAGNTLDERARDYLRRMTNAAERMQKLIESLLHYSRINTRGKQFERANLDKVMQEVADDMEINIAQAGARLEIGKLPVILADPVQMRQLLQNLVANAIKFHRPGEPPVITVTSREIGHHTVEITVKDNGIGFSSQFTEYIFLPFYKLHGRDEYEGTGIGLSICEKIVHRHRGSIKAESVEGKGSSFIIKLPRRPMQDTTKEFL